MNNSQTRYDNFEHIESILEIRLCQDTWRMVKQISMRRGKSYSWVVRYALFRLIKRKNPAQYIKYKGDPHSPLAFENMVQFDKLNEAVLQRRHGSSTKHRHRLCLYGEDEMFIRLCAARLRCTMTHLVRFALEKYIIALDGVIFNPLRKQSRYQKGAWHWLGIKIHDGVEFPTISISKIHFNFQRYHKLEYW